MNRAIARDPPNRYAVLGSSLAEHETKRASDPAKREAQSALLYSKTALPSSGLRGKDE
jgi:hypothetical protein